MTSPPKTPTGPTLHRLSAQSFRVLALGEGTRSITDELWRTENSRRLLLVAALLRECTRQSDLLGPLPKAEAAQQILGQAQTVSPEGVTRLLMHPQVGSWAAYALRRQRGGASSDLPLWADFGVINALALVAAARAGLSWQTQLPVRGGEALLPAMGVARLPDTSPLAVVDARTSAGRIELSMGGHLVVVGADSSTEAPHWWGLRRIRTGADLILDVLLDDVDPYRDLADPVPAKRLDDAEFDTWTTLVRDAWTLLSTHHRSDAEAIADGVVSIVPLQAIEGWGTRSASTGEAFGSVMLSPPTDAVTMALTIVHEFQHIKLGALMHLLPMTHPDDGSLYYAPWRDDPRPLGGLLQGVYAFLGIAAFWRRQREVATGADAVLAEFEYAHARAQTRETLRLMQSAPGLTDAGNALVDGLLERSKSWLTDPVPADILRLAELTVGSHRIGWRLRHLTADPAEVSRLAEAWRGDQPPGDWSAAPTVTPHPDLAWPQRVPALARRRVLGLHSDVTPAQPTVDSAVSPLTQAETQLVAGDYASARAAFSSIIVSRKTSESASIPALSVDDVRAWTGLVLAIAFSNGDAAGALTERPDLVRAVYAKVADTLLADDPAAPLDPVVLAGWLVSGRRVELVRTA